MRALMIGALSLLACCLSMAQEVCAATARLRLLYLFGISAGICYIVLDVVIAVSGTGQTGVLLLLIPSVWMIGTSVYGLRRLARGLS